MNRNATERCSAAGTRNKQTIKSKKKKKTEALSECSDLAYGCSTCASHCVQAQTCDANEANASKRSSSKLHLSLSLSLSLFFLNHVEELSLSKQQQSTPLQQRLCVPRTEHNAHLRLTKHCFWLLLLLCVRMCVRLASRISRRLSLFFFSLLTVHYVRTERDHRHMNIKRRINHLDEGQR